MGEKVIRSDKGWRALLKAVAASEKMHARVGILGSDAVDEHSESGMTNAEIAFVHEYGSRDGVIPERSFIRSTFVTRKAAELRAMLAKCGKAMFQKGLPLKTALGALGAWGAAEVKNTITQTDIPPPLEPATIAAKGSSKPLVDTGQLLGSITWDVVDEKAGK